LTAHNYYCVGLLLFSLIGKTIRLFRQSSSAQDNEQNLGCKLWSRHFISSLCFIPKKFYIRQMLLVL